MSGYIASPCFPAPPRCSVSKPTCHCQQAARRASRLGHQAHQHLPRGFRGCLQASRAGSGRSSRGVEWRWTVSRGKTLTKEQKLGPDYSIWSPQLSWSLLVTSEWDPLVKAGFVAVCKYSEAVSVLLFGRAWLLSRFWDTRMSREQLAHSEQTATPRETLSISFKPSSSAPTNTRRRLGSLSSPSLFPLFSLALCPLAGFSVWI